LLEVPTLRRSAVRWMEMFLSVKHVGVISCSAVWWFVSGRVYTLHSMELFVVLKVILCPVVSQNCATSTYLSSCWLNLLPSFSVCAEFNPC
jgi:hypothetical protein